VMRSHINILASIFAVTKQAAAVDAAARSASHNVVQGHMMRTMTMQAPEHWSRIRQARASALAEAGDVEGRAAAGALEVGLRRHRDRARVVLCGHTFML